MITKLTSIAFVSFAALVAVSMPGCAADDGGDSGTGVANVESGKGKAGDACGSRGLAACGEGLACIFAAEAQCGATDVGGKCAKIGLTACPEVLMPVCGCDNKNYDNECLANALGVSVASSGACRSAGTETAKVGEACGSRGLSPCEEGLACVFPIQAACGKTDQAGTCVKPGPSACPAVAIPVCGCDGVTYGNECKAAANGISVAAMGTCAE